MNYNICIFDLDGTISNPYEGLIKGIQYAQKKLGISCELDNPGKFIGPPLHESFKKEFALSDIETGNAVSVFREYYGQTGLYENELYPGIRDLLLNLSDNDIKLAVATTKPDKFARLVLKHFELFNLFEFIQGDFEDSSLSRDGKQELIRIVLDNIDPERNKKAIMIGDRHHDINGARGAGIDSIGITWGYGTRGELSEAGATYIADTTDEVLRIVAGNIPFRIFAAGCG